MFLTLFNLLGILVAWGFWVWLANQPFSPALCLTIAILGPLLSIPFVLLGRWLLDREPSIQRAVRITTVIHYLIFIPLIASMIEATQYVQTQKLWGTWSNALPGWVGLGIMVISGVMLVLVVFNLALKGLGAPFAIALTRVVATDWLYAWTRNPMVLSAFAFLLGLGLWLKSSLFILWLLIVVSPPFFLFLRVYEERELEIRFRETYLTYKAQTPMFFPFIGQTSK